MSAGPYGWPMQPPPSRLLPRLKLWGSIGGVLLLLFAARTGLHYWRSRPHRGPLPGYDERVDVLRHEYKAFYGQLMSDPGAERLFEEAGAEVVARRYPSAIELLR